MSDAISNDAGPQPGIGVANSVEPDGMLAYTLAISADVPDRNDPNWPLPSFNAQDWAEAFCKINPGADYEIMLSWFANALVRGYDQAQMKAAQHHSELVSGPVPPFSAMNMEYLFNIRNALRSRQEVPNVITHRVLNWAMSRIDELERANREVIGRLQAVTPKHPF